MKIVVCSVVAIAMVMAFAPTTQADEITIHFDNINGFKCPQYTTIKKSDNSQGLCHKNGKKFADGFCASAGSTITWKTTGANANIDWEITGLDATAFHDVSYSGNGASRTASVTSKGTAPDNSYKYNVINSTDNCELDPRIIISGAGDNLNLGEVLPTGP